LNLSEKLDEGGVVFGQPDQGRFLRRQVDGAVYQV
jgi:hypothetical protein